MRVTCDYCKNDFEVDKVGQRNEDLEGERVTVIFLVCPHCNEEYIALVTDDKTLQMKKEWSKARETFNNCDLFEESQRKRKAWKEMEYYKKKVINYQDKLRKRYMKELKKRGY